MPRLENWSFWGIRYVSGMKYSLVGEIYNDERFVEGTIIRTSPVAFYSLDKEKDTYFVTTKNGTKYQLGEAIDAMYYQTLLTLPKEV